MPAAIVNSRSAIVRSARYRPPRNTHASARHRVRDYRALGQLQLQRRPDRIVGHLQEAGRQQLQLIGRQPAMSLVHRFAQRVGDTGANADHGRLLDAQLHRDHISGPEADPANVPGKAIWIFRHDLDSVGAVGPEYPHRTRRADAVAVQEHHDLADGLLLRPGVGDALRTYPADAAHLAQPFRLRLDDVEDLVSKRPDQLAGIDRADAPDHAGPEVFLDALDRRRCRNPQEARLELLAVGTVVDPVPGCRDPLARRHHGGVADDRDQVAMPPRLGSQDAEPVLRVVEGYPLDQPGQDLPVRRHGLRSGDGLHDVPGSGAFSSSLTRSNCRVRRAEALASSRIRLPFFHNGKLVFLPQGTRSAIDAHAFPAT